MIQPVISLVAAPLVKFVHITGITDGREVASAERGEREYGK